MLTQFKLSEALAWLTEQTGRQWTDSELFQMCVHHGVPLHAAPPLDARVSVVRLYPSDGPEAHPVVQRLGWQMAVLYPFNVWQLWQVGEAEPHPASLRGRLSPLEDGEIAVYDPPVRLTREHLAIERKTLARIVEAWRKDEAWRRRDEAKAQATAEPAPCVLPKPSRDEAWKQHARAAANSIIDREKARDLYPSQIRIADEVAADLRKRGVFGPDGKPLSGATIKRHALKGMSSAAKKAQSTNIKRGK